MDIAEIVKSLYRNPAGSSLLLKYVDRDYWIDKLKEYFPNKYIDNLTEFNYDKCFSMYINLLDNKGSIGTKEFDEYIIENKNLYILIIEISVLAPYCEEHMEFHKIINDFISDYNLILLDDNTLMREVPNISLELKEPPVSVYNCLFENSYCYYPYLIEGQD